MAKLEKVFEGVVDFLRPFFCLHESLRFVRKSGGDENNVADNLGGRFVHRCLKCGVRVYRSEKIGALPRVFSFDAETNGLYGQAFMLAAVVTDESGEIARFVGRCPIEGPVDGWVEKNVLPNVMDVEVTHLSYAEMLEAFFAFYMKHKEGAVILAHMAFPVEAKVLRDMIEAHLPERQWEGPYPLIDVAGTLDAAGFDPTSVDIYNKDHGLTVPFAGTTHHPLYDSWAAEVCYRHLKK